MRSNFKSIS